MQSVNDTLRRRTRSRRARTDSRMRGESRSVRFTAVDRLAGKLAITILAAACLATAAPSVALAASTAPTAPAAPAGPAATMAAKIAYGPCRHSTDFACGHLTVPLDPSGSTPGTISLAIRRHRAALGPAKSAVIALAGGPGQPAIPFTADFAEILGPILRTRDLIVFDQRGTGRSHPLACHAFEGRGEEGGPGATVRRCAKQIGSSRRFYTTADSVADIEAIRVAGGYEKLVLYGTSYGTKVAEQYAEAHPSHVEALVLDSVVPPAGPEPLGRATFAAVPRVLKGLCAFRGCAGITRNPVRNLRRLVHRIGAGRLRGTALGGHGVPHPVRVSTNDLVDLLLEGDLDPLLRSEFPAAIRSALTGDRAPLSRLLMRAEGEEGGGPAEIDLPLYYATSCEEQPFPWSRASSPRKRLAEAKAKVDSLPASALSPFTAKNMLALSDMPECAFWPFPTRTPPAAGAGALPAVPTLILSGRNDLRTPTSEARQVAAAIRGSHLLVVPNAGHDVLGTEQSSCGLNALHAFFAKKAIKRCASKPPARFLRPTPLAPRSLGEVHSAKGYRDRSGRTLGALAMALIDLDRQIALQVLAGEGSERGGGFTVSVGGLRHGWAHLAPRQLTLHDYSYVPGMTISGYVRAESAKLTIGGSAAAHGTLRLNPHGRLLGRLGSTRVDVSAKGYSASAALRERRPPARTRHPRAAERRARQARAGTRRAQATKRRAARSMTELNATIDLLKPGSGRPAEQAFAYSLSHAKVRRCAGGC